ncbi:TolC family protein [Chryseobacterium indologenes]|uniref:TolC family protein n=1 Tax=Chryseobacterium indologenes TaxID=253 RepID=UPI0003E07F7D|nr:TolC family protein [Chryseobacterium indologenes]ASE60204.1 TolC family protein [Chryseobacterium indologenes]AYZ36760.1 TolC family protein [Chryseobacterium indologenes]MBF6645546.1 TolC family protein [Chryseobacterium indologenes]MBU3049671.1 TolC family protein [Chryseobacterium indologenes]MEB4760155.1 TolC family protein [Chryseobacterium indologenes]
MKRLNHRNIVFGIAVISLSSCAVPKVADVKKARELPQEILKKGNSTNSEEFQQLNLKAYFTEPQLLELFDKVVQANPDFQIAQQRVEIANSFLQRSKMDLLPSLEVGVEASGNRYGKYTMEGVGNYDTNLSPNITEEQKINRDFTPNYWLGARSSWEIDAWGKLKNKKIAAQKKFLASAEGLRLLQVELFTDIANLYYQLVALDNRLAIYQKNYNLQQRAFEIVLAQREVGKATELAVQQFKAQNNNWLAEIEHIKVEIVTVEQAITTLTGSYGGDVKRGKTLMPTNMDVLNKNINVEAVIHSRPDVAANYYVLEASQADAKAARAAFYPKIDLGAGFGLNSFSVETLFKPSSLAGQLLGGLMVPVFNKGQLKYEFKVASKEQEIAFLNYQKSITTAFNELQSILKQTKIYERVLQLKSEEVGFLDRGVEVSNDLYLTGYANYFELINSQKSKLTAELDLLQFQHQNTRNNVLLFKALGGKLD